MHPGHINLRSPKSNQSKFLSSPSNKKINCSLSKLKETFNLESSNSTQIETIMKRVASLQQTLNKQCSYCDSLMPVLQLYDYGIDVTRHQQNIVKNLNKNIGYIEEQLKKEKKYGFIQTINKQKGQLYKSESLQKYFEKVDYKIKALQQKISQIHEQNELQKANKSYITQKQIIKFQNLPSSNQKYMNIVQQYRNKAIKSIGDYKNRLLLLESRMKNRQNQKPIKSSPLIEQADKWIRKNIIEDIYLKIKQKLATMKINLIEIDSQQPDQEQKQLDQVVKNIQKLEDFHEFTYNRIGEELVELNTSLELIFNISFSSKQPLTTLKSNKTEQTIQNVSIRLKLILWQIKGLIRKQFQKFQEFYGQLGNFREIIYNQIQQKDNEVEPSQVNKNLSLYKQLISYSSVKKHQKTNNHQQNQVLQHIEELEYMLKTKEREFAEDIQMLSDIYQSIQQKYITFVQEQQNYRNNGPESPPEQSFKMQQSSQINEIDLSEFPKRQGTSKKKNKLKIYSTKTPPQKLKTEYYVKSSQGIKLFGDLCSSTRNIKYNQLTPNIKYNNQHKEIRKERKDRKYLKHIQ